jgi:hypothetical protein
MDLQKILSHRETCFICQEKLTYSIPLHPNLIFSTDNEGFHIRSGHKQGIKMNFNFDGTYQRNKKDYKIYQSALAINKNCRNCSSSTQNIYVENEITINNIMSREYGYSFIIDRLKNNYVATLNWETVRYRDDQQFFHIYNNHYAHSGEIHHATLDKNVKDIFNLRMPSPINLSNINNVEEYINKCKIIINFS